MFEVFKIIWDVIVLRDASRKGLLSWQVWVYGFGFVILLYAIGLPAVVLYSKHPQYKPLFIAAIVLDGALFVAFLVWAMKWWAKLRNARAGDAAEVNPRALAV